MTNTLKLVVFVCFTLVCQMGYSQSKTEVANIKTVIENLMSGWKADDPSSGEDLQSWIPEYGIRGKYAFNKTTLSLKIAETLFGVPVFKSGPHKEDPDYSAETFGHYNPEFLKKADKVLKKLLKDKAFVAKGQAFYDNYLKKYIRTYWVTYTEVTKVDIDGTRENLMKLDKVFDFQEYYRPVADKYEAQGYIWYEVDVCCGFWLRRVADATDKQFYALLKTLMSGFDKEGMK